VYRFGLMRIRSATPSDLEFIAAANSALASETEGFELDSELLRRGIVAVLQDGSLGRYFVAEEDGEVLGQLLTTYEWSDWRNGLFLWIQSVYVAPAHRGHGVFRALFRHVASMAREDPRVCGIRLYVDRANERAQAVYGRLGMHRTNYGVMETVYRGPESHVREDRSASPPRG
jgi:ribosomal protein S18 acetylase RimI-like enzyme